MKFNSLSSATAALFSLIAVVDAAGHGHGHTHLHSEHKEGALEKRGGQCQFPTDAGLVPVTPHRKNAGWAMSPDQPCRPGHYCPYACSPSMLSVQWDPKATSYSHPMSMNGGLYCDENGNIQKPFPDKPYCQDGTGTVVAVNKCNNHVSFCQTVLPGNEAMLIPTLVKDLATLAVPAANYWLSTSAHYFINPPGIGTDTACVWGSPSNAYGNWAPYITGANTDKDGQTFLKLGWNPIYLEPATPFHDVVPEFGVEIVCEGDGCNGLPCMIDPAVNSVNKITGSGSDGAGNGAFCVVTVPKGQKANVVVFDRSGGGRSSSSVPSSTSSLGSTTTFITSSSATSISSAPSTSGISSTTSSFTPSVQLSTLSSLSLPLPHPSTPTPSSTPAAPSPSSTPGFSVSAAIPTSSEARAIPSPTSFANSAYKPHVASGDNSTASNSGLPSSSSPSMSNNASGTGASIFALVLAFIATVMMRL